jgi:hypothetical protein
MSVARLFRLSAAARREDADRDIQLLTAGRLIVASLLDKKSDERLVKAIDSLDRMVQGERDGE